MRKPLTLLHAGVALAAMLSLTACSLTPVYQRPEPAVPAQWPPYAADASREAAQAPPVAPANVAELAWTSYFPDARLQGLIGLALNNNRDLRMAVLHIAQWRALYQVQQADRFPTLNGAVSGTRQPATAAPHAITSSATGGVTVSAFELDIFGRIQALSEAASAQVMASEEARKAAHISLIAAVANAYYLLWADRWQLSLSEHTVASRQASLKLQQLKFDAGVLNELDWRTAQSLFESARVTRAQAQRQWLQDTHALNLLLGSVVPADLLPPIPDVADATDAAALTLSPTLWPGLSELPVGLSSDVLLQRPDVAQAEQQLIAANANIGAARAARFPRITLTGNAGVVSDSLSGLFNDGRSAWSFSPSLTLPIWDAGRIQAGIDSAHIKRDIALAQYDKTLQTAFKEVADALVSRSTQAEQAQAQYAQAQAETARWRVSTLRYESGVSNQLDWLDAQRSLFGVQQAWIASQLARQQAHISVYKALGGGMVSGQIPARLSVQ